MEKIKLPEEDILPEKPKWATLFIAAGKKDKVNKMDIVGFLTNKGRIKKRRYWPDRSKRFFFFRRHQESKNEQFASPDIKDQKIKNKKVKMEVAK